MEGSNLRGFALFTPVAEGLFKEAIFDLKHDKKREEL